MSTRNALELGWVDLKINENTKDHNTDEYDITHRPEDEEDRKHWTEPKLVLRRGQTFMISVLTSRKYDQKTDQLGVQFKTGSNPSPTEGSLVRIIADKAKLKPREWGASVVQSDQNSVTLNIMPAVDCAVGKWNLHLTSSSQSGNGQSVDAGEVYILFNPWCKDDQVYMADNNLRDECVMNDTGRIYSGDEYSIWYKPWNYAQFEDIVLDCALALLDSANESHENRGNATLVARAISAVVNVSDGGLLYGKWPEKKDFENGKNPYEGGTAPTEWAGSHAILREFWETKRGVKYAQCWVFSGVCTTIGRALGLPTRSVTNFASAHDSDGTITIDLKYIDGKYNAEESERIWNFHVWNEGWMTRPDLPEGYGGWQAFDATPQEESAYNRKMCAGPCSVKAIKQGDVNMRYEGQFIFAEVNGDAVAWYSEDGGKTFPKKKIFKSAVGKYISTKLPRSEMKRWSRHKLNYNSARQDITLTYKHPEGSEEERKAVRQAAIISKKSDFYDTLPEDIDVAFELKTDKVEVGSKFNVTLNMKNKTNEDRSVVTTITVNATAYTGIEYPKAEVAKTKFEVQLGPSQEDAVTLTVEPSDYQGHLVGNPSFRVIVLSKIRESNQWNSDMQAFRLLMPEIKIAAPDVVHVDKPFDMDISFHNPLPINLTSCRIRMEGAGFRRPQYEYIGEIKANETWSKKMSITPFKVGDDREMIVSLFSKEVEDVGGSVSMKVVED